MDLIRGLVILLVLTATVVAHDHYPPDCCDGKDCKIVSCGDIIKIGEQRWRYGDAVFSANNVRKPRDENCHICTFGPIGRCIFFPMPSSS